MTARVPMVSLERARDLGEAMGMSTRRTQSEAFRTVANHPGVARVAFSQLMQRIPLAEGIAIWPPDGLASPAAEA